MKAKTVLVLVAIMILTTGGYALAADTILSGDIMEADGTSGQDTNSGSGIKTDHIQDGAVTGAKIKNYSIGGIKLKKDSVTTIKIKNFSITKDKLKKDSVTSVKIMDGAIWPSKISFYSNIVIVNANGGGDYSSPVAALDAISDASLSNRYLVKVMPGIYDIGTNSVQMKQYVDIEGSGEGVTVIRGTVDDTAMGVVNGVTYAEIRKLTVENLGSGTYGIAIRNSVASPSIIDVITRATGGATYSYGIRNTSSSPLMTNVRAIASGGSNNSGVQNTGSSDPVMNNVYASASGPAGSYNYGIYNSAFSNPLIVNTRIEVSGGAESYGIYNSQSMPEMVNVLVSASGGDTSTGIFNHLSSQTITNIIVTASGVTNSYGLTISESDIDVFNVSITGEGGTNNYGIRNLASSGSFTVKIDHSIISGDTATINNDAEFTTLIGNTKLDGGDALPNSGTLTCVGVYDEAYASLNGSCL